MHVARRSPVAMVLALHLAATSSRAERRANTHVLIRSEAEATSRSGWGRRPAAILSPVVMAAFMAHASAATGDEPHPKDSFTWNPAWSHADSWDYAFTGVAASDLAVYLPLLQSKQPALNWTRPILFDTAVRDFLRGSSSVRSAAEPTSWALLGVVVAYPFVVDLPYAWKRGGPDLAWDLFWQDATALSLATAIDLNLRDVVGRARPPVSECLMKGGTNCLSNNSEATRSFPGGHQLIVTTAASLTCTQHLEMQLYGGAPDVVACAAAATTAFAVGVLRIVADDHWASDILVGDLLGVGLGWGVPTLMHLHGHAPAIAIHGAYLTPTPIAVRAGGGVGVTGLF
jgi:membrane-associated phospholipid phosphatase